MGLFDGKPGDKVSGDAGSPVAASSDRGAPSLSSVAAVTAETKRGRGRPPGSGRSHHGPFEQRGASKTDVLNAERAAELEALYKDENWQEIAGLYFQARYAMTGWDGFLLTATQKSVLGATLAASMRVLLAVDPKWVAICIFTINFGAFITDKELRFRTLQAQVEAQKGRGA